MEIYLRNIIPEIHNILVTKYNYEPYNLSDMYQFNSFLAKLQHYGFPTPLLDWTYNPYIATFFAINDKQNLTDYFAIYVFDYAQWIKLYPQPIDLLQPLHLQFVSTFLPNNFGNERAKIQESIFTITNVQNVEFYLHNVSMKDNFLYIRKFLISKKEINKIEQDLKNFGITKEKIFPSLDEICRNFKEQFLF